MVPVHRLPWAVTLPVKGTASQSAANAAELDWCSGLSSHLKCGTPPALVIMVNLQKFDFGPRCTLNPVPV